MQRPLGSGWDDGRGAGPINALLCANTVAYNSCRIFGFSPDQQARPMSPPTGAARCRVPGDDARSLADRVQMFRGTAGVLRDQPPARRPTWNRSKSSGAAFRCDPTSASETAKNSGNLLRAVSRRGRRSRDERGRRWQAEWCLISSQLHPISTAGFGLPMSPAL